MAKRSHWAEIWDSMDIELLDFSDLGLSVDDDDRTIWNMLQRKQVVLITNNRNEHGLDSLQATIKRSNTIDSLPVITISRIDNLHNDREYAMRVIAKLVEILFELDQHRGAGRLYIP